jgi:hypothetical protein
MNNSIAGIDFGIISVYLLLLLGELKDSNEET